MPITTQYSNSLRDWPTLAEIEAFIQFEAELLDTRKFEEWLELFTEDSYYWCPTEPEQDNPHDTLSIFYDTRDLLETRIKRLRHPSIHVQTPPSRTQHLISYVRLREGNPSDSEFTIASNFFVLEYRQDNQRLFGGTFEHRLRRNQKDLKIAWKKVNLINCDSVFDPIAVPF